MFAKKESQDVARSNAKKDVKGDESHYLEIGKMTICVFYRCDIVAISLRKSLVFRAPARTWTLKRSWGP